MSYPKAVKLRLTRYMMEQISRPWLIVLMMATTVLAGFAGGPDHELDRAIIAGLSEFRAGAPGLSSAAAMITTLGGAAVTLSIAGIAALYLLLKRHLRLALILVLTVLVERALVDWLKDEVARVRPSGGELFASSLAYPSGHAANSMTAFLAVALLAVPPVHRGSVAVVAIALSLLIGLTRILLGIHWPSDVFGGWALGIVVVAAAIAVARRSGALRLEPDHEVVGRHGDAGNEGKAP